MTSKKIINFWGEQGAPCGKRAQGHRWQWRGAVPLSYSLAEALQDMLRTRFHLLCMTYSHMLDLSILSTINIKI
jgi:hypothetical protein